MINEARKVLRFLSNPKRPSYTEQENSINLKTTQLVDGLCCKPGRLPGVILLQREGTLNKSAALSAIVSCLS